MRLFGLLSSRAAVVTLDTGATERDTVPQDTWPDPSETQLRAQPLVGRFGIRVAGEIDLATRSRWERMLNQAVGRGFDVHVELSGLTFTDVAGVALLVSAAERVTGGRRIIVHQPPRGWQRIFELFWPDGVPGVEVVRDEHGS